MGINYMHFVTPRDETWYPPTDLVFDIDASLRRMGLVCGEATVYERVLRQRPKKRGKLSPRIDLSGEVSVDWEATEEEFATAGSLFGNQENGVQKLEFLIGFDYGPSYKVETGLDANDWTLVEEDRARAKHAAGFNCQYLFDANGPPPKLRAPEQLRSPYSGSVVAPDPTRSQGVYCARLRFDFGRADPYSHFASPGAFPMLPSHVKAELERAFAVPLREGCVFA